MKTLNSLIGEDASSQLTPFQKRVYEALIQIPAGQTITYQDLAKLAGSPKAARAVGYAMAKNPFILTIPCHRVINANGTIGQYSAGGESKKIELLQKEGIPIQNKRIIR